MNPAEYSEAVRCLDVCQKQASLITSNGESSPEGERVIAALHAAKDALEKLLREATPDERKAVSIINAESA